MTKNSSPTATVRDVERIVTSAMQSIVEGIDNVLKNMATKDDLKATEEKLDARITGLEIEVRGVKDDIKGLTEELAMTPSRRDFKELKEQVGKIYLSN